jgi:hypothetical protein
MLTLLYLPPRTNINFAMRKLVTLLFLFGLSLSLPAQLYINEYSCANTATNADNFGEYNDWFEVYNAGTAAVNLAGYYISDNDNNPTKWQIPSGSVNAGGIIRIVCSGRGIIFSNWIHAGFKLTQCKPEELVLADASGNIIDSVTLRRNQLGHSWGRTTNGASTWSIFVAPTFGTSNNTATPYQPYTATPVFSQQAGFYPVTPLTVMSPQPHRRFIRLQLILRLHKLCGHVRSAAMPAFRPVSSKPILTSSIPHTPLRCFLFAAMVCQT